MGTKSIDIQWPARSPDMTPLDFYFWGFLKNAVYKENPINADTLKQKIKEICRSIPPEVLKKTTSENVLKRMKLCVLKNGNHFEHIIKKIKI